MKKYEVEYMIGTEFKSTYIEAASRLEALRKGEDWVMEEYGEAPYEIRVPAYVTKKGEVKAFKELYF